MLALIEHSFELIVYILSLWYSFKLTRVVLRTGRYERDNLSQLTKMLIQPCLMILDMHCISYYYFKVIVDLIMIYVLFIMIYMMYF